MSYKKRKESPEVEKANKRLTGLFAIDPNADLGNSLTAASYENEIKVVKGLTETYNTKLSEIDGMLTTLEIAEKSLADYSRRILNAVGSKYGYDSVEYEKIGGTRKSDKKRPTKKKVAAN